MRILILSTFFPPLNSIASLRPHSWAKYWTLAGHDVTVVTTAKIPDATDLKVTNPGYHVVEVPLPLVVGKLKPQGPCGAKNTPQPIWRRAVDGLRGRTGIFSACRMPDLTDLWIPRAQKIAIQRGPWDVVVSSYGPYAPHLVARHLKNKGVAKTWAADFRDLWYDNPIYRGLPVVCWVEKHLQHDILRSADVVTTVSEPLKDSLVRRCPTANAHVIMNGFDPDDMFLLPQESIFPHDGKVRMVYTGNIYRGKRDPTLLFRAMARMNEDPAKKALLDRLEVVFVGVSQENIASIRDDNGVMPWVKVCPSVSRERALCMQRDAQYLLFLDWADHNTKGIVTGKLYEYLFSGTSIVSIGGPSDSSANEIIHRLDAGWTFDDVSTLEEFLTQIVENPDMAKKKDLVDVLQPYLRSTQAMAFLKLL